MVTSMNPESSKKNCSLPSHPADPITAPYGWIVIVECRSSDAIS